jgi:hypothetical protein
MDSRTGKVNEEKQSLLTADHLKPLDQGSSSFTSHGQSFYSPQLEGEGHEFKVAQVVGDENQSNSDTRFKAVLADSVFKKDDSNFTFYNNNNLTDFVGSNKAEDYYGLPVTTKFAVTATNPVSSFFRGVAALFVVRHCIGATFVEIPDGSVGLFTAGDGRTKYLLGAGQHAIYGDHRAKRPTVISAKCNFKFGNITVVHTPKNQYTPATLANKDGELVEGVFTSGTTVVKTTSAKFLPNLKKAESKKEHEEKHLEHKVAAEAVPELNPEANPYLLGDNLSYDPNNTKRFPIGADGTELARVYDRKFMLVKGENGAYTAVIGPDFRKVEPNSLFISDKNDPDSYMAVIEFDKITLNKFVLYSDDKTKVFSDFAYQLEVTKHEVQGKKVPSLEALNQFQRIWGPKNPFVKYEDNANEQKKWPDQDKVVHDALTAYVAKFSRDDLENEKIPLDLLSQEALSSKGGAVVKQLIKDLADHGMTLTKCQTTLPTNEALDRTRTAKAEEQSKISEALKAEKLKNENDLRRAQEAKEAHDKKTKQEQEHRLAEIEAKRIQDEQTAELQKRELKLRQDAQTRALEMQEKIAQLELAKKTKEAEIAKTKAEQDLKIAAQAAADAERMAMAQAGLEKQQAEAANKLAAEKAVIAQLKATQELKLEQDKAAHEATIALERDKIAAKKAEDAQQLALKKAADAQKLALENASATLKRDIELKEATQANANQRLGKETKLSLDNMVAEQKAQKEKEEVANTAALEKLKLAAAAKAAQEAEKNKIKLDELAVANKQLEQELLADADKAKVLKIQAEALLAAKIEEQQRNAKLAETQKALVLDEKLALEKRGREAAQTQALDDLTHKSTLAESTAALVVKELKAKNEQALLQAQAETTRKELESKAELTRKTAEAEAAKAMALGQLEVQEKTARVEAIKSTASNTARLQTLLEVLKNPDSVFKIIEKETYVEEVKHTPIQPLPTPAPMVNNFYLPKDAGTAAAGVSAAYQSQNMFAQQQAQQAVARRSANASVDNLRPVSLTRSTSAK